MKKSKGVVNYVVKVVDEIDSKHASLKKARLRAVGLEYENDLKGLDRIVEIFKESVKLDKLKTRRKKAK